MEFVVAGSTLKCVANGEEVVVLVSNARIGDVIQIAVRPEYEVVRGVSHHVARLT